MLRLSDPKCEGRYQVSHPLKFPVFLTRNELEKLFEAMGRPLIAQTSRLVSEDEIFVQPEEFFAAYERRDRAILSSVLTKDSGALYGMRQKDGRILVRSCQPVMQMHLFHFTLSHDRQECLQMAHGSGAIPWGIELFFPTRFRDPKTLKDCEVLKEERFVNRNILKAAQKWVRQNTIPTPLLIDGARKNQTFRLGKEKVSTINRYEPLIENGLKIEVLHD